MKRLRGFLQTLFIVILLCITVLSPSRPHTPSVYCHGRINSGHPVAQATAFRTVVPIIFRFSVRNWLQCTSLAYVILKHLVDFLKICKPMVCGLPLGLQTEFCTRNS